MMEVFFSPDPSLRLSEDRKRIPKRGNSSLLKREGKRDLELSANNFPTLVKVGEGGFKVSTIGKSP